MTQEFARKSAFVDCTVVIGKSLFISNLYKEAQGKELKIAHSQGCSRLLERLILLSTPAQLKALFQCFSGQYAFQSTSSCFNGLMI